MCIFVGMVHSLSLTYVCSTAASLIPKLPVSDLSSHSVINSFFRAEVVRVPWPDRTAF